MAGLLLAAALGMTAQQNKSDSTQKSKQDATAKHETSGARELFYLAVAPKDKLPPISRASAQQQKNSSNGGTTSGTPPADSPAAAPAVHLGIRYNLVLVDDNNKSTPVESDRVFRRGDCVATEIEANRSGYLYVLAKQSSGQWQPLLPSPEMSDESNIIDPGRKIRVPAGYCFEIKDPPGSEHLVLVFSRDPQDFYELYQSIKNPKTNQPTAAPKQERAPSSSVQMADASRVNNAVERMEQQFGTRDISIRKVSQPLSSGEPTGSVYVVNSSNKPASSVVTEIEVKHR